MFNVYFKFAFLNMVVGAILSKIAYLFYGLDRHIIDGFLILKI